MRIMHLKNKTARLRSELQSQKESYENKIKSMLAEKKESNLDLTKFYHQKIDYLQTELTLAQKIRGILESNVEKLKGEITTLARIVRTGRQHFKELEKTDFDSLNQQVAKYES